MNNVIGIFGIGVLAGTLFDLVIQILFKHFGGKRLKKSRSFALFLDINLFIPALGGLLMILFYGSPLTLKIFFVSAVFGTIFEMLLGKFLFYIHRKPVWEYQYLPIGKFTSWVSVLYWGVAGMIFVKIASLIK